MPEYGFAGWSIAVGLVVVVMVLAVRNRPRVGLTGVVLALLLPALLGLFWLVSDARWPALPYLGAAAILSFWTIPAGLTCLVLVRRFPLLIGIASGGAAIGLLVIGISEGSTNISLVNVYETSGTDVRLLILIFLINIGAIQVAFSTMNVKAFPQTTQYRRHDGKEPGPRLYHYPEAPAEIGIVTSAESMLVHGERPWTWQTRLRATFLVALLCGLVAYFVGALKGGIRAEVFGILAYLLGFLSWFLFPRHQCTFVGKDGIAIGTFGMRGDSIVVKFNTLRFCDAAYLFLSRTAVYKDPISFALRGRSKWLSSPSERTMSLIWTDSGRTFDYCLGCKLSSSGDDLAPTFTIEGRADSFHFLKAAMLSWNVYLATKAPADGRNEVSFPLFQSYRVKKLGEAVVRNGKATFRHENDPNTFRIAKVVTQEGFLFLFDENGNKIVQVNHDCCANLQYFETLTNLL